MTTRTLGSLFVACALIACGGAQHGGDREDPEAIVLEGALGNTFVPAAQSSEIVARLRVGTVTPEGLHRPPINLALVVDTSGSMEGRPIDDARAATAALLDAMHDGDRLAVVAFHSSTEIVLPSTQIDRGRIEELREQVSALRATGTTDLGGGMRAGLEEVMRHYDPQGINRVVLLSDGVPNDPTTIEPLAQAAGERGIAITALGLGTEYDETLLAAIAQRSGGRFHFVEESSAVARVFQDEVLRMRHVLARNLSIEIRPGPGVRVESVVGQPQVGMDGSVRVALGDVAEGETRDVIVRLRAEGRRTGAMVELMDAVLTFDDAVAEAGRLERRLFLGARATADEADLARGRDESVERDAARMMAAAVTVEAIRLARGGELDEARVILAQAALRAEAEAQSSGDASLAEQAQGMRSVEMYLPSVAATAPSAAPPPPEAASDEAPRAIRAEHERAVRVLQGPL
ncbi:vWA domain-containing protein [Sandaracinus amylolyticus]|uniref:VWFA domain-containing protein n=1 Tax=Sandaracinus amylolyticus TaxID=927083 RepID=A0A0F6YJH9_9BACT|nr:VWA domain-containing protein [Sandaracinus amylolyticus]AKF06113.1 hypothetical protein DB32_003262 [Sandaracinus amylolyticus]